MSNRKSFLYRMSDEIVYIPVAQSRELFEPAKKKKNDEN